MLACIASAKKISALSGRLCISCSTTEIHNINVVRSSGDYTVLPENGIGRQHLYFVYYVSRTV